MGRIVKEFNRKSAEMTMDYTEDVVRRASPRTARTSVAPQEPEPFGPCCACTKTNPSPVCLLLA